MRTRKNLEGIARTRATNDHQKSPQKCDKSDYKKKRQNVLKIQQKRCNKKY